MSLFDVIKYPLNYPPTEEQLDRIPPILFEAWLERSCFQGTWNPLMITRWFGSFHDSEKEENFTSEPEIAKVVALRDFRRLQQMILEYEG